MDKLAVVVDDEKVKTANVSNKAKCPVCSADLSMNSNVPCCPNCGTAPFEKSSG